MSKDHELVKQNRLLKEDWQRKGMISKITDQSCIDCGNTASRWWYPRRVELVALHQLALVCTPHYYKRTVEEDPGARIILRYIEDGGSRSKRDIVDHLIEMEYVREVRSRVEAFASTRLTWLSRGEYVEYHRVGRRVVWRPYATDLPPAHLGKPADEARRLKDILVSHGIDPDSPKDQKFVEEVIEKLLESFGINQGKR